MTYLQWRGRIRYAPALLSKFILAQGARRGRTRMGHSGRTDEPAGSGGAVLTRRDLLELAGLAFATTAIPPVAAFAEAVGGQDEAAQGVSPVMDKLSRYMSEACERALPDDVLEKAKHHIVDTLAAMISGSEIRPAHAAIEFVRAYGGKEVATVVASNIVCGPIEAALANGVLAHADETDDSHGPSRSHPGVSAVPAALAAGEQFGISGKHFLRAVTLGYDVGTRVTMSMGGPGYQMATHRSTHGTVATFAAGAAAGCAAGLNAQQMRLLLDYSAQQTSGIGAWSRDAEHMEKAFLFGGRPAAGGVIAGMLIRAGWTGVDDIFSGPDNFFDALAGFFQKRSFTADDAKKVVVRIASDEANTVSNRDMPDICVQHMVAVMLLDKTVTFRSAHDKARMKDPAVLKQRAKVEVVADPRIDARRPRREAIVEVTLGDGTQLSEWVRDVRGTAENPLPREEVVAKAHDLIAPILGAASCATLINKVLALEDVKDIRELRPALQRI